MPTNFYNENEELKEQDYKRLFQIGTLKDHVMRIEEFNIFKHRLAQRDEEENYRYWIEGNRDDLTDVHLTSNGEYRGRVEPDPFKDKVRFTLELIDNKAVITLKGIYLNKVWRVILTNDNDEACVDLQPDQKKPWDIHFK